jgi:hypothetical protein
MARTAERRTDPRRRRPSRGHFRAALAVIAVSSVLGVMGLWIAVNRVAWLGPYVADGLRAVVGTDAVADLEDFAYHLQDRINRVFRRGEKPRAHWQVPTARPLPAKPVSPPPAPDPKVAVLPPFRLRDVGPVHKEWSAPGDGDWVPMLDPDRPDDAPYLMKTLLHPDKNRSWAEVFVVAVDLRRARLQLVAGTKEPVATEDTGLGLARPGMIPKEYREVVIAAFNGGFKTEHGQYGMFTDGTLLVKPKPGVCAIAAYNDDTVRIGNWDKLAETAPTMKFWRETPVCMYENDVLHFRLADPALARKWGATLDGETVIRRSAIGIDRSRDVLFVSISNHTTARVIADGMHHAGAVTVAQLDVNFSYPKFVTFEKKKTSEAGETPKRIAIPLADGFEFSEDEYIREPARRDFFYLVPKDADVRTALKARGDRT